VSCFSDIHATFGSQHNDGKPRAADSVTADEHSHDHPAVCFVPRKVKHVSQHACKLQPDELP